MTAVIDQTYYDEHYQLAQHWGCNGIQFKVLLLLEAKGGQMDYDDPDFHAMTLQPGRSLRSTRARGWIDGPDANKHPRSKPWTLNDEGREILRKVKIGLRPLNKLTPTQYRTLVRCGLGRSLQGIAIGTIASLVKWGYIYGVSALSGKRVGQLTELGQEAYEEIKERNLHKR